MDPFGDHSTVDVFPPTAEGILNWYGSTRPQPARTAVVAYARELIASGQIDAAGRRKLSETFSELKSG